MRLRGWFWAPLLVLAAPLSAGEEKAAAPRAPAKPPVYKPGAGPHEVAVHKTLVLRDKKREKDLQVRITDCDAGAPGEARLLLEWTAGGALDGIIRATDDARLLESGPPTWNLRATDCLPLDPAALVFYSVTDTCDLGGEGYH